jgi:hypothetical protein
MGRGCAKTPQEILFNQGSSQTVYCLGIPPQTLRYDPLSLQSLAALYNMRYPAAIKQVSTNTLYKLKMRPKILLNSLHNRLKKYFTMKVLS